MGFRIRRSVRLFPGVRLNFGRRGTSVSIGQHGATINISKRGTRATVGIPGTGISYSEMVDKPHLTHEAPRPGGWKAPSIWPSLLWIAIAVVFIAAISVSISR